ncbi:MAG: 5-guanidino-2-oxopentanoate decarboxylase [Rhodobacteraceae bacterium]|nr:5-guanidino-2-oxopentanoate decarboxylase [Paracoccaceae bacterium]
MTLGEYLIKLLEAYDVDTVFGIPGVHTVEMYRGLAGSSIQHITPRHEQGAGFMADGYARTSGKPGVAFVITGPGLTNIITAMGQAYGDSIPMLVISAVNHIGHIGHGEGELHESPNQGFMAAQVAASSFRVLTPSDLPKAIARAFASFEGARPRPVHIEIPVDLFAANADGLQLKRAAKIHRPRPSEQAIKSAVKLCNTSQCPVILLGGGARGAAEAAQQLAERLDAPVVMTINGRGLVAAGHPLEVPASPSLHSVRELINKADLVLAFGTELGRTDYNMFDREPFSITAPLIRADIDPVQIARNQPSDIALVGDAGAAMRDLLVALGPPKKADGAARAKATRKAAMVEQDQKYTILIGILESIFAAVPDAVIVGDSTQLTYAGNLYLPITSSARWFNSACGFGALGYGLPAAIGARVAAPERPVICIAGDGGLQFSLAELGAAMEVGGPLVILCWNNHGFGEIKSSMIRRGVSPIGVDLHTPDFVGLATAYGLEAVAPTSPDELPALLHKAVESGKPVLIQLNEALFLKDID